MVLRINSASATIANITVYGVKKTIAQENNTVSNPSEKTLYGVPKSYISFRANKEEKPIQFTDDAKILLEKTKAISKKYGHEEHLPTKLIQTA